MMPPPGYILIRPETLVGVQKAVAAALGPRAECPARVVETTCAAMGAERCRFESVRT